MPALYQAMLHLRRLVLGALLAAVSSAAYMAATEPQQQRNSLAAPWIDLPPSVLARIIPLPMYYDQSGYSVPPTIKGYGHSIQPRVEGGKPLGRTWY